MANNPKGNPKNLVGSKQRVDADIASVQQGWNTDKLDGQDPAFAYQFMRKEEVTDRTKSKTVYNRATGKNQRVTGWTVCQEGEGVEMLGSRPDVANPIDTAMTMGPHVLMRIPLDDHALLLHEKDAVPDAMEHRLMRGGIESRIDDVATVANAPFAPHPSLMGKQGTEEYSAQESKLMGKFAGNQ
jgi:hypothetical protein